MFKNLSLLYRWKTALQTKNFWWVSSPSSKMKSALTLMSVVLTFILSKTSKGSKLTARLRKTKRKKARKAPQPFLSKILFSWASKIIWILPFCTQGTLAWPLVSTSKCTHQVPKGNTPTTHTDVHYRLDWKFQAFWLAKGK